MIRLNDGGGRCSSARRAAGEDGGWVTHTRWLKPPATIVRPDGRRRIAATGRVPRVTPSEARENPGACVHH